jgi:imidazolonepropionase-like amidohydrolase
MRKLITLLFFVITSNAYAQTTYIHCGRLIDGLSNQVQNEMTIIIEGNKIINVIKGYQAVPSGSKTIDMKNATVMPGLIDAHVHISSETSKNRYTEGFVLNEEDFAFRSVGYAERTLMAGFTTVRDLGGTIALSLRNAINGGYVKGPKDYSSRKKHRYYRRTCRSK